MPNKKFTHNDNNNNRLVGPPRGKSLDGQAPTYSTMQIRTLKLLLLLCVNFLFGILGVNFFLSV